MKSSSSSVAGSFFTEIDPNRCLVMICCVNSSFGTLSLQWKQVLIVFDDPSSEARLTSLDFLSDLDRTDGSESEGRATSTVFNSSGLSRPEVDSFSLTETLSARSLLRFLSPESSASWLFSEFSKTALLSLLLREETTDKSLEATPTLSGWSKLVVDAGIVNFVEFPLTTVAEDLVGKAKAAEQNPILCNKAGTLSESTKKRLLKFDTK